MLGREGRSESTAKQPLHWSKDFQRRNRANLWRTPQRMGSYQASQKDVFTNWKAKACSHGSFGPGITKKALTWKPHCSCCQKARTSKPYVCTSFATDTTGKGYQELFQFKTYSEILNKAGSEQSFFPDHGILNIIFCMCSFLITEIDYSFRNSTVSSLVLFGFKSGNTTIFLRQQEKDHF